MIFNMTGGGAPLNFTVVGGTTQPSNPKENTIWVNTSTAITGWVFSAKQPSNPTNGMVWISVGNSSASEFNALKKNTLQVYPNGAKQYENGKFVDKTAYISQNGEWNKLIVYLLNGSDECEKITGGWQAIGKGINSSTNLPDTPTVTKNNNSITLSLNDDGYTSGVYVTNNKIDLSAITTIFGTGVNLGGANTDCEAELSLWTDIGDYASTNKVAEAKFPTTKGTFSMDVTSLKSSYYVGVVLLSDDSDAASATIESIWME